MLQVSKVGVQNSSFYHAEYSQTQHQIIVIDVLIDKINTIFQYRIVKILVVEFNSVDVQCLIDLVVKNSMDCQLSSTKFGSHSFNTTWGEGVHHPLTPVLFTSSHFIKSEQFQHSNESVIFTFS